MGEKEDGMDGMAGGAAGNRVGVNATDIEGVWRRQEQRAAMTERERQAMAEAAAVPGPVRRTLKAYDREKPTRERQRGGAFEVMDAAVFEAGRKGEKVLLDWRGRAGGAGEMHARGQLRRRELAAAVRLCELAELARSSQLSGLRIAERVDGGLVGIDGGDRLASAASAAGEYRRAVGALTVGLRALVEHRVVLGRPMEEVVRLKPVVARVGTISIRKRCEKANVLVAEALDQLADLFGFARD
jgi:hypothetical protein